MGLQVVVGPAQEPLTLDQAKRQLGVDHNDDDVLIGELIAAARERVEDRSYTKLITQTLLLTLDHFPYGWPSSSYGYLNYWPWMEIPTIELEPPVQSISSVQYIDPTGTLQTLQPSQYDLDTNARPCRLTPALNVIWPPTAPVAAAVQVLFVAGFGADGSFLPNRFLQALRFMVGHYYLNREQILSGTRIVAIEIPEGFDDLLRKDAPPLVA